MTSFFVENLKGYAQLRYFTHMDLGFLWWKGGKGVVIFGKQKAVWGWKEQGIMV